MATANAISALQAGSQCISATVNGLGERSGNAVLEEVVAWANLNQSEKIYNTTVLAELSNLVAQISNKTLLPNKPVTGSGAYRHESGVHTAAILKNSKTYQSLNPADYGLKGFEFVFGKHSGKHAVKDFLHRNKRFVSDHQASQIQAYIQHYALKHKNSVPEKVIVNIADQMLNDKFTVINPVLS